MRRPGAGSDSTGGEGTVLVSRGRWQNDTMHSHEPAPLQPRFLTLKQCADELNTSAAVIRGLIHAGQLPAIQIGGRGQWRIERTKLEQFITDAYKDAGAV